MTGKKKWLAHTTYNKCVFFLSSNVLLWVFTHLPKHSRTKSDFGLIPHFYDDNTFSLKVLHLSLHLESGKYNSAIVFAQSRGLNSK